MSENKEWYHYLEWSKGIEEIRPYEYDEDDEDDEADDSDEDDEDDRLFDE